MDFYLPTFASPVIKTKAVNVKKTPISSHLQLATWIPLRWASRCFGVLLVAFGLNWVTAPSTAEATTSRPKADERSIPPTLKITKLLKNEKNMNPYVKFCILKIDAKIKQIKKISHLYLGNVKQMPAVSHAAVRLGSSLTCDWPEGGHRLVMTTRPSRRNQYIAWNNKKRFSGARIVRDTIRVRLRRAHTHSSLNFVIPLFRDYWGQCITL